MSALSVPPAAGAVQPPPLVRGRLARSALRRWRTRLGLALVVVVALIAIVGPFLSPHDPDAFVAPPFAGPSGAFPLGADELGRDVLSRVLSGGRVILLEAIVATILGVALGVLIGMATGRSTARMSRVVVRLNDVALALPQLVLTLLVLTRIGPGVVVITLVVAAFHVPLTARVIRAATLRVVQEDFISAVEAMGLSRTRILLREILPNISAPCCVEFGIRMAISIVTIASLGYLGFGGLSVDWGRMVYENQAALTIQPWGVLAPALVMAAFVIGVNLLTDGLSWAARRMEQSAPDGR